MGQNNLKPGFYTSVLNPLDGMFQLPAVGDGLQCSIVMMLLQCL